MRVTRKPMPAKIQATDENLTAQHHAPTDIRQVPARCRRRGGPRVSGGGLAVPLTRRSALGSGPRDNTLQVRAARFIIELRGSYSGVMGLPLYETSELLEKLASRR